MNCSNPVVSLSNMLIKKLIDHTIFENTHTAIPRWFRQSTSKSF